MITPENILRHELIGLRARVECSKNKTLIGLEGLIVDETKNTIRIKTKTKEKTILKSIVTLRIFLNGSVIVDGKMLIGRPEERIKKKMRWRDAKHRFGRSTTEGKMQ
ncbi:MAG: ribonuclease P protein component 1 [Candidatus Hydrothermarchaeota archaeon]